MHHKFPLPERHVLLYKFAASSQYQKELFVNDLYSWLSGQHAGLRTFKTFQQKLANVAATHPQQRAACMLLSGVVGRYIEEFDEAPLPSAVADRAYSRLLHAVAELNPSTAAVEQLVQLNRLAELTLTH